MLSQAVEDYLKTIFKLQQRGPVSTNELATAMGVTAASATNMVKRLASLGLAAHRSYRGVTLTPPGEKIALEVIRHHRLLELYLREVMGYGWQALHAEAEQLEHHISEEFEQKIEELLGYPTHDPHGDPIPTREGALPPVSHTTLADTEAGTAVRVERLSDHDPALLDVLEARGLLPGAEVRVLHRAHDGALTLECGGTDQRLARTDAAHVFVRKG